jgi:hypothetical protein
MMERTRQEEKGENMTAKEEWSEVGEKGARTAERKKCMGDAKREK